MQNGSEYLLRHGFGFGGWMPRCLDRASHIFPAPDKLYPDEFFMAQALLSAMDGVGLANPNPCVGAVVVKEGRILAKGATLAYGDLHAERVVLQQLSPEDAAGSTIYVTLEPCSGKGKQPACADAIIAARVSRCVIGTRDPHPKAGGQALERLRSEGIEVEVACMEAECQAWHFPFLMEMELDRPVIIGKWAQTLDGQLADDKGGSRWISGSQARVYTHWLRQKYDTILVGIGTVLADHPSLTVRDAPPPIHRHPHKIIFDPHAKLQHAPPAAIAALGKDLEQKGPLLFWMIHESHTPVTTWEALADLDIKIVPLKNPEHWLDNLYQLRRVYQQHCGVPLQSILVEGGPQILTQLLRADLLDLLHVFIRAKILGGKSFRVGRFPPQPDQSDQDINPFKALMDGAEFDLLSSHILGQDVLIECIHPRSRRIFTQTIQKA